MQYLVPLDGIRAVAILAVLTFHVSPDVLPGGFTGVDVFFVLSGYLITSIILTALNNERFSMREFYLRRFKRLVPNLLATIFGVYFLWVQFMPASAARQAAQHGLWALFSLSNIYIWKYLGGYWGNSAESAPLTHTWSLGVEEQFYLFYPCALVLLAKFHPRRLKVWLLTAAALSFGLCWHGSYAHPAATFYLLPSRLWELLLGAALATHIMRRDEDGNQVSLPSAPKQRDVMAWSGFILIFVSFTAITSADVFPGFVALLPTIGTVLVVWSVASGQSWISRCLSCRLMTGIGKLSYSLYLWHWPLITFGKMQADFYGFSKILGACIGGVAGVLAALAGYFLVEQPFRARGVGSSKRLIGICAGCALSVVGSIFLANQELKADKNDQFDQPTFSIGAYDVGRNAGLDESASSTAYYDVKLPLGEPRPLDSWREGGIVRLYGGGRPRVVVFGSSHGLMYSSVIDEVCRKMEVSVAFLSVAYLTSVFFEASVNPNFPSELEACEFDKARLKWLSEWNPEVLFMIDRWDFRVESPERFRVKMEAFLKKAAPHVGRIVFVSQVPVISLDMNTNLREYVSFRSINGKGLPLLRVDTKEDLRKQAVAVVEDLSLGYSGLCILRADKHFYHEDGTVRYAEGRRFFYANIDHLTDIGAAEVRGEFEKVIREAVVSK